MWVLDEVLGDAGQPRQRPGAGAAQAGVVQAPVEDGGDVGGGVDLPRGRDQVQLLERVQAVRGDAGRGGRAGWARRRRG